MFNHVFIFKIKYSDVVFNISKYSYITQLDEGLFDNDIVYTCICLGDWTKLSWPLSKINELVFIVMYSANHIICEI